MELKGCTYLDISPYMSEKVPDDLTISIPKACRVGESLGRSVGTSIVHAPR